MSDSVPPRMSSQTLPAYVRNAIKRAMALDGVAKTYRAARIGESALRRAVEGVPVAQLTFDACTKFAEEWMRFRSEVRHDQ